jgi:hypothetical protein
MAILTATNKPAGPLLSLADLGAGTAEASTGDRRFVCPLCDHTRHKQGTRQLSANMATGAWQCWHCGERGKLTDYWADRPALSRKDQKRERLRSIFHPVPRPEPEHDPGDAEWRVWLKMAVPLAGSPGEAYLAGRGIPRELAAACGVTYMARWYGRGGVAYPLHDRAGVLAAVGVRYIVDGAPKTRVRGKLSLGAFATPGAFDGDTVMLVEGPADALSLALTGRSAVALHRTSAPDWVVKQCAFKRVLVGLDADATGDEDSVSLIASLRRYGAMPVRLRPPAGKDWNDALIAWGIDRLREWLSGAAALPPPPPYRYVPFAGAASNARCRFCRRPSHAGDCLHPLGRPGALQPPRQAKEHKDDEGNPYACPALASGAACPSCARRMERDRVPDRTAAL